MPYILGAFGASYTRDNIKKLSNIALEQTAEGTLQTTPLENGIIFAGYKRDENYHYDNIIPLQSDQGILADQGILVGKIFDRANYNPISFNNELAQTFINNPKNISKLFWGRYVGALFNETNKTLSLIRDPQGLSTIFYIIKPYF